MAETKRFYVGNLVADITENDLRSLFDRFGTVVSVDTKHKRDIDGNITATFAFVKLEGLEENDVSNVIKQCNHLKWKKQIIRVQLAQESFMDRLQKEREGSNNKRSAPEPVVQQVQPQASTNYDPLALIKKQVGHSDGERRQNLPSSTRRRYYSSSDDEDAPGAAPGPVGDGKFLSKLESFNADFWNDCEAPIKTQNRNQFLTSDRENKGNTRQNYDDQDSNSKRLASLNERQTHLKNQKQSIKSSLSDASKEKKKVTKFGSDDEGQSPANFAKTKSNLFDADSEEEEGEDRFRIRPQFEGKTGEKLLSLQSKFANDERFKIDVRFKDKDEKKRKDKTDYANIDEDTKEERLRNLKILSSIIGKSDKAEENGSSHKMFKDPSTMRFDPSQKDHKQFLVPEKKEDSSSEEEEEEKQEQTVIKNEKEASTSTVSDKNYWVSNSLSQALAGTKRQADTSNSASTGFSFGFASNESNSTGFSLLSKFGKAEVEHETKRSGPKHLSYLENNPFKYESSDTEEEKEPEQKISASTDLMVLDPMDLFAQKLKEKASATKGASESFFFRPNDARFEEGRFFFTPTQSIDEMRSKHEVQRPLLAQIMKKKLRRRAKKQEKLSFDLKGVNRKGGIVKKKFGFKKGNFNRRN